MLRRFILFTICLSLLASAGYAQVSKVGTAGAKFLNIGVDPRGVAMGYAFTAVTDDIASLYWNPAGIAVPKKMEFYFSDVEWISDIRNNFMGFIMPLGERYSTVGISITALTMGDEEITTIEEPEGTGYNWSANSIALGLTYSRWFTSEVSVGVTAKLVRESIWDLSALGGALDIGVLFYPGVFKNLSLGIAMTNFGTNMKFEGVTEDLFRDDWATGTGPMEVSPEASPYSLPLHVKLGVAYNILTGPGHKLLASLELDHPNDGPEQWHTGVEYGYNGMFFVRGGFTYNPNLWDDRYQRDFLGSEISFEEFSGGFGFKYSKYAIDYAAEDRGRLGIQHHFAFKIEL
ncbi:PorV/PorQ family protein [bacterium]|nr:PorV/PorQ family protein [bacterium]